MHRPQQLKFAKFNTIQDPLCNLPDFPQTKYLRHYLAGLKTTSIVEEPNYFDRDFLSEFTDFYSSSARGYPNICRRLHFFSGADVDKSVIARAASGDSTILADLKSRYMGFTVLRPIDQAPFGRTVLTLFPNDDKNFSRIMVKRKYKCHVAGIELEVEGLAWQQQDRGVSACATIALWSAFHSCAFDDRYSMPTTSEITKAANKTAAFGTSIFPSRGLSALQMLESIKELRLSPAIISGETNLNFDETEATVFNKERFLGTCAAFLRSNYPIVLLGESRDPKGRHEGHAVCIVGFREGLTPTVDIGKVKLQDSSAPTIYIHEDNLGPNVRFVVSEETKSGTTFVVLKPEAPPTKYGESISLEDPSKNYGVFIPGQMVVPVSQEIRMSPDNLHGSGLSLARSFCSISNLILAFNKQPQVGFTMSARFLKVADYLDSELERSLKSNPPLLGDVRIALAEQVAPMSLYLGVLRVGYQSSPMCDFLFDTTDSDPHDRIFAHIVYDQYAQKALASMAKSREIGTFVKAF